MQCMHRVYLATHAGITAGVLAWVGVAVGSGVANGSAKPVGISSGQRPATVTTYVAEASVSVRSPFPDDFTGNPLLPGRNQRSVSYLLSHDGYDASLSGRRSGTLEVTWTALRAAGSITLSTGQGSYGARGDQRFGLRLTRRGRAALTRTTSLTFRVAGRYGRTPRDRPWLCLYVVAENSAHKLVFSNACGP
jgi:hypothetical protein